MDSENFNYVNFLKSIKNKIVTAQSSVITYANLTLLYLYWEVGKEIEQRKDLNGWGARTIIKLASDLKNELSEVRGFSVTNLKRMSVFYREYPDLVNSVEVKLIGPVALGQLQGEGNILKILPLMSWTINCLLIEKVKDLDTRYWYAQKVIQGNWSYETLYREIKRQARLVKEKVASNFNISLNEDTAKKVLDNLKDPYIFDFLTLTENFQEKELEHNLILNLEKFLIELGQGFAFVGRQFPIKLSDQEYYIDLLFYHYKLRCFVVIELKKGAFKPEYAGKLNFYCNVVDDFLSHPEDQKTIGLILCQSKDKIVAEYSLRGFAEPIGVSEYELTKALPENFKSSLPTVEEIEAEFNSNKDEREEE